MLNRCKKLLTSLMLIISLAVSAETQTLQYKKFIITAEKLKGYGLTFQYDFLNGKIDLIDIDKSANKLEFFDSSFEFEDFEKQKWKIDIKNGSWEPKNLQLNKFTLYGEGAYVASESVQFSGLETEEEEVILKNTELTPCNSVICWAINVEETKIQQDEAYLTNPKFGIDKFKVPWLNLTVHIKPASGFLRPNFQKDEFDGFLVSVPYYIYLDETDDFIIAPAFGEQFSVDALYKHLGPYSIFKTHANVKYYGLKNITRGGYLNMRNQRLDERENWDVNLLLVSSKEYAKYWDNKENNENRQWIPSYVYYADQNVRAGGSYFIASDDNSADIIMPKIVLQNRFKYYEYGIRTEYYAAAPTYIFSEKERGKTDTDSFNSFFECGALGSITASYKTYGLLSFTEVGVNATKLEDSALFSPFMIQSLRFPVMSLLGLNFLPYFDTKIVRRFQEGEGKSKYKAFRNIDYSSQVFYETLVANNKNNGSAAKLGVLIPIENFEFDFGYLNSNKIDYGLLGVQYANKYMLTYFKDQFSQRGHMFSGALQLDFNKVALKGEYSTFEFDKTMHHKFNASCEWKLTSYFSINANTLFRIKPENELLNGGVNLVFTNDCWIVSFGISHGANALDYQDTEEKTMFTFSIGLNGFQRFQSAAKKLKTLKMVKPEFIEEEN